ncbi:MAG: alanine racemase [Rhodobacteraceae bacterium]|nr:alanine racemase [Paracoccaceae bacterium]
MTARPNSVEIDPGALASNLATLRGLLRPGTVIWQVCKGDGYGLGTERAASLGAAAGIDRFCVGTPDEALALRRAQPRAQVLLFPSALAADLPALARAGVTVSLHSRESLAAIRAGAPDARCWLKIDAGLHRYGFDEAAWPDVLSALRSGALPGLQGIYTHFSQSADPGTTDAALSLYDRLLAAACAAAGRPLASMVAASPLLLARPDLSYDQVDPGRALYGIMQPAAGPALRPVVTAVRSVLLDCRTLPPGETIGYGAPTVPGPRRVGTFPLGHFDGLNTRPPYGKVLIRGRHAPVLGRTLLASIVDLSAIDEARAGDRVTLVGTDGTAEIGAEELAADLGVTLTELHFGLVRAVPKANEPEQVVRIES